MREIDLSRTGYYDYLIRVDKDTGEHYVNDSGIVIVGKRKELKIMRECFIPIDSIRLANFENGKVEDRPMHHDGFYDYQVTPVDLKTVDPFSIKLKKAKTYEEALVIIKEAGRLIR